MFTVLGHGSEVWASLARGGLAVVSGLPGGVLRRAEWKPGSPFEWGFPFSETSSNLDDLISTWCGGGLSKWGCHGDV